MGSFIEGTRKGALKNALMNVNQRLQVGFDTIQELFAAGIEDIIQEVIHLIKGNSHNLTSVEKELSRSIVKQG
jgi:flagellar hook-basal body complex protein FliE